MKTRFPLHFLLILVALAGAVALDTAMGKDSGDALTVMTFNIRFDNPKDANPWKDRKGEVAEVIRTADIVGLQEALKRQIEDLEPGLEDFSWFGVGRDDGKEEGEHTCIFYRKERFRVIEQDSFWLSETPEKPGSKSWDAAITRIATWGKLEDRKSGAVFYVFNTHFDHRGPRARLASAKLIVGKIAEIAGEAPVVLMGDFNTGEHSEPYDVLVGTLKDARFLSGKATRGPRVTSTAWTELRDRPSPIDYIFVNGGVRVHAAENVGTTFRGLYPSDHLPVRAVVGIED